MKQPGHEGSEFLLGKEENWEQSLLSAGAVGVTGENSHPSILGSLTVFMIFTYLAKM